MDIENLGGNAMKDIRIKRKYLTWRKLELALREAKIISSNERLAGIDAETMSKRGVKIFVQYDFLKK